MMARFNKAAEILNLEPGVYEYLQKPVKQVIVSIPIQMDSGEIKVFEDTVLFMITYSDLPKAA
jgi:glutamate dehydrogenase (NAD(P)+)